MPKSADDLPQGLTLEPDTITVPGQNYALVSFVGPTLPQKNEKLGMKIRGVFATVDEAKAHVQKIQRAGDKSLDIFLLDMYQWCLIPPDPEHIEDHEYQEEYMQNLMKGYAESQRAAKEVFNERKEKIKKEGLDANLLPHERQPPPPGKDGPGLEAVIEEDVWMDRKGPAK